MGVLVCFFYYSRQAWYIALMTDWLTGWHWLWGEEQTGELIYLMRWAGGTQWWEGGRWWRTRWGEGKRRCECGGRGEKWALWNLAIMDPLQWIEACQPAFQSGTRKNGEIIVLWKKELARKNRGGCERWRQDSKRYEWESEMKASDSVMSVTRLGPQGIRTGAPCLFSVS